MAHNLWWIWMIIAAVFVIGEIFTAGFFLLWFGIGAAVAGILALLGMSAVWQWVAFVAISAFCFAISRRFADRVTTKQPPGIGADRFQGKEGIVLETIDNTQDTGRIRVSKEEWRAESESGETILEGKRVLVVRMAGTHAVVRELEEGS